MWSVGIKKKHLKLNESSYFRFWMNAFPQLHISKIDALNVQCLGKNKIVSFVILSSNSNTSNSKIVKISC